MPFSNFIFMKFDPQIPASPRVNWDLVILVIFPGNFPGEFWRGGLVGTPN